MTRLRPKPTLPRVLANCQVPVGRLVSPPRRDAIHRLIRSVLGHIPEDGPDDRNAAEDAREDAQDDRPRRGFRLRVRSASGVAWPGGRRPRRASAGGGGRPRRPRPRRPGRPGSFRRRAGRRAVLLVVAAGGRFAGSSATSHSMPPAPPRRRRDEDVFAAGQRTRCRPPLAHPHRLAALRALRAGRHGRAS